MFFIPLSQVESVDLVIHALRVAGGLADCSSCPARRVCMKQCLAIADAIERMQQSGTLPALEDEAESAAPPAPAEGERRTPRREGHLTRIK